MLANHVFEVMDASSREEEQFQLHCSKHTSLFLCVWLPWITWINRVFLQYSHWMGRNVIVSALWIRPLMNYHSVPKTSITSFIQLDGDLKSYSSHNYPETSARCLRSELASWWTLISFLFGMCKMSAWCHIFKFQNKTWIKLCVRHIQVSRNPSRSNG